MSIGARPVMPDEPERDRIAPFGSVTRVRTPGPRTFESAEAWPGLGVWLPPWACPDAGCGKEATRAARTSRPAFLERIMRSDHRVLRSGCQGGRAGRGESSSDASR